jgi:hypothetical protein
MPDRRSPGSDCLVRSRSISHARCCWSSRVARCAASCTPGRERDRRRRRIASGSSADSEGVGRAATTSGCDTRSTFTSASRSTLSRSFRTSLASHGCVRIPAEDARFVFDAAPLGTPILIHGRTSPVARRSALVFRPREIANVSCRRSRTDDGAAMPSVYLIKQCAAPRPESQALRHRAAQHNGLGRNTGSDRPF